MTDEQDPGWFSDAAATFGDRLCAAREAAGLDQAALASNLGVKLKTLRNWENDMSEPRANRLQMLAGILGVSLMWLINGEGDGVQAPPDTDLPLSEAAAILADMRRIRSAMSANAQQLARLERRLERVMNEARPL